MIVKYRENNSLNLNIYFNFLLRTHLLDLLYIL